MNRIPSRRAAVLAALLSCLLLPAVFLAQGTGAKALVVCPPTDAAGCDRIATQLALATNGGSPVFPGGVEKKYTELRTMSLSQLQSYSAVFVPSLANAPYDLLRESAVRNRLSQVLRGRVAVLSGTPDRGVTTGTSAGKLALIQNLGRWAAAQHAVDGSTGLVVLQDFSDALPDGSSPRYQWIQGIAGVSVAPVTTVRTYAQVEKNGADPAGAAIMGSLAYDNMASFGLASPASPGLVGAWGQTTSGKKTSRGEAVLVTFARTPSASYPMTQAGGTINAQGGKVVLVFPAGAVSEPVSIVVDKAVVSETNYVPETAYSFAPSITFAAPVSLTISYLESNIPGGIANEPKLLMCVYKSSAWTPVAGSTVNAAANTVTAPIDHFSRYAIFVEGGACGGGGGGGGSGKPVGSVAVAPLTANVSPGQSIVLTATVADKSGNPLSGRTVAWTASAGSLSTASATTDAAGKATTTLTAPATPGPVTVTAESGGKSGTSTVTVNAGPAAKLVYVSGDGGTPAAGTSRTLEAKVTDASDNPVSGHTVSWAVTAGGGAVSAATSQTNSSGVASITWTFGATAGTQTATASASGPGGALTGSPLTYNATTVAGDAARLAVTTQPSAAAQAGAALATQPVVQVQDANGNPVSQSGIAVTAALGSGTGALGGTTTATTDASGQASFTNLSICGTSGAYTLAFTAGQLTAANSNSISLSAGAAASLTIHAGNAQSAAAGTAVATAPAVRATDSCGNPVAGVSVTFTVASGGGSATGSPATTDANGVAAVGSWTLGAAAGANSLDASASGLTTVTFTATGTAGAAASLAIHAGDGQTATVGAAVATAPAVRVTDSNGNPTAGVQVTFSASGNGSVTGSPATTDANGVATVGSWTLATTAGANTLTASATGLTSVQFTATGTAGAAASMTKTAGDGQSAPAGTAVTVDPQVTVTDANGNPVAGVSVTFTPSTGGSVAGSPATTDASGVATLGSWTLAPTTGPNTLTASAPGLTSVQFSATGTAGAPAKLALTTQPSSTAQAGIVFSQQPVLQVQDANGVSVSQAGIQVTVQIASGGGTLGGSATATTDASGQATFSGLFIGGMVGSRTLSFTASGLADATSNTISVTAGPAAALAFSAQPSNVVASAAITPAVQVSVVDAYGNLVTGATDNVTLAIGTNPSGGTLSGTTSIPATGGVATFSNLSINLIGSGYTLTASSGALSTATSVGFNVTHGPLHHFLVEAAGGGAIGNQLAGTPFNVRVTAQDEYNNTATSFTGTVGFTSTPSGGISTGSTSGAFTGGVLTSHAITFGTAGSFTLTATRTAGSETGTSNSFDVQAPPTAVNEGPAAGSAPGQPFHAFFSTSGSPQTFSLSAPGVMSNDNLGFPLATITSFGADSLGGSVTTYAAGSTVSPLPGTGRTTGSLSVGANGTITFTPPDGFTGNYVFRYRLTNLRGTSDGQVTIAVGARPAAANDTYSPVLVGNVPINTATSTQFRVTSNDAGDAKTLAITGQSNGTATLNADSTFTFRPNPGFEGTASFSYTVSNGFGTSAPATVSMTVANPIWFVNAGAGAGGDGRYDAPFNSLGSLAAINNGTGSNPAASDRIFLYTGSYTGPLTLLGSQRLIGQGATASLSSIAGVTWPADAGSEPAMSGTAPTLTASSAVALMLANVGSATAANNTLRGFNIGGVGAAGTALAGTSFGTLAISEVGINTDGRALNLATGTLNGSFPQLRSTGGANNVLLTSVATTGTSTLGTASDALSGATGDGLRIDGGNGSFTYAGSITNTATLAVNVTNKNGGTVTVSGQINPAAAGRGIVLGNNSSTTISFTGSAQKISSGTGAGVGLSGNNGSTISFTGGALEVASTTGNGINVNAGVAPSGGTLVITGANNTITSAGGVALNVANTTIGAGGLVFRSISANGGTSGIVLNNTGATAGLTVAGTGATGTGGTIQNTTGDGIVLTSTVSPTLSFMDVSGSDGSGINGTSVSGLALTSLRVLNNTDALVEAGVLLTNLSGTNSITATEVSGSTEDNVRVVNSTGTLNSLTFSNCTIRNNSAASGNVGINVQANATAVMTVSVSNCALNGNRTIALRADAAGTSQLNYTATNNTITAGTAGVQGNQGIEVSASADAQVTYNLATNKVGTNGTTSQPLGNTGINIFGGNRSTMSGKITSNQVVNAGAGISGFGIRVFSNDTTVIRANVSGNTVSNVGLDYGILAEASGSDTAVPASGKGRLDVALTGNNVSVLSGALDAIRAQARHNNTICGRISGNTAPGGGSGFFGLVARQANAAVFNVEGLAAGAQSGATTKTYLQGQNPASSVDVLVLTNFNGVPANSCTIPN